MQAAKSIDELYDEVKEYDLVICNDAPLALALNNRLDKAIVGTFANTPRRIAQELSLDILGRSTMSDIEVIRRIADSTGYRLRFVHGEVQNIQTFLRYRSDIRRNLRKRSQRVFDELSSLPTLDSVMLGFDGTDHDYFKGRNVAVIGDELFDNLDKHMLPGVRYEPISLFKRGTYTIPVIREMGNDRQIAENAVSLIDKSETTDFAIVMDTGSGIADAVRSALYRKRIPFKNSLSVRDLNHVREYLEFIRMSLSFDTVRVAQIRELISSYGGKISSRFDEYLAAHLMESNEIDDGRTKELLSLMDTVREKSFQEVCDKAANKKKGAQIKVLLDEMNLSYNKVSESDYEDLQYAVDNITSLKHNEQIPDNEKEGVLLVDCKNSTYIDRPVVIFVGMGNEWDKDLSFLNQIDYRLKADENAVNLDRFQILLQQGTERVYIVKSTSKGKKQIPCSMFDQCTDNTVSGFEDVCGQLIKGPWVGPREPNDMSRGSESFGTERFARPFSKTSYNKFVSCPRMYMYGALTGVPDNDRMVSGNLIHEYAEMRICYPDIAKRNGTEFYVDFISERCSGLHPPEIRSVEISKIRNAIENIDRFVDVMGFDRHPEPDVVMDREKPNTFILMEGYDRCCSSTEIRYTSADSRMEGIFDIMDFPMIYDLKTGSAKEIRDMLNGFDLDKDSRKEFQPLFYLSLLEELHPDRDIGFSLFYANDKLNLSVHGAQFDIRDNLRTIRLCRDKSSAFRSNGSILYFGKNRYKPIEDNWDSFQTIACDYLEGRRDRDSSVSMTVAMTGKNTKTVLKDMNAAFNILDKLSGEMFIIGDVLYVTKKGLQEFREMISRDYTRCSEMYNTIYPAKHIVKCTDCEFRDMCTADILTEGDIDV